MRQTPLVVSCRSEYSNEKHTKKNKEEKLSSCKDVRSPTINFEIDLNAGDAGDDEEEVSKEIAKSQQHHQQETTTTATSSSKSGFLSVKRPVSSPTFHRSQKRNSTENKGTDVPDDANNNNENKGQAVLGRVYSAPPAIGSESSNNSNNNSSSSNNSSNSSTKNNIKKSEQSLVSSSTSSGNTSSDPPHNYSQAVPAINVLFAINPAFEALHVKVLSALKELLPQEERASFFAQHYQLPLRLYYKLVSSNPQKKPTSSAGASGAPKHAQLMHNPLKHTQAKVFSPIFQVTVSADVYANILFTLKSLVEKIDRCSDFTRVLVWTQMFSLVGCTLSNSKRFGPVIESWFSEEYINILAVEILYVSFLLVQILHPAVFSGEREDSSSIAPIDSKEGVWKTTQAIKSAPHEGMKMEKDASEFQSREISQQPSKSHFQPPKGGGSISASPEEKQRHETNYLSLHSRHMLLLSWSNTLEQMLDAQTKEMMWKYFSSLQGGTDYKGQTFKQVVSGWSSDLNKHARYVDAMFQTVQDFAVRSKRLREVLCFPHTQIPVFSGSDIDKQPNNSSTSAAADSAPSKNSPEKNSSSEVMNIKYILS